MFKPMLAPGEDPQKYPNYFKELRYPLMVSPKYDGIRCLTISKMALSRSGKLLPSWQVQEDFTRVPGLDGELIEGNPTDPEVYNRTQSHVMSTDKPGNLKFFVFDCIDDAVIDKPFYRRLEEAAKMVIGVDAHEAVDHTTVERYEELVAYENQCLSEGYEGIMMRDPLGRYKNGRGTFKEGLIYKLKRFTQTEGHIVDIHPRMHNTNPQTTDELGYASRSQSKDGLVAMAMAGKFILDTALWGEVEVAPGAFTHQELEWIWENKLDVLGKTLTFKFFSHGIKDKPRFPRAVGFRHPIDMS